MARLLKFNTFHNDAKNYNFNQCGYSYNRPFKLEIHLRVHSGEKPYVCSWCNYSCTEAGTLKVHMRINWWKRPDSVTTPAQGQLFSVVWNIPDFPTLARNPLLARNANTHAGRLVNWGITWKSTHPRHQHQPNDPFLWYWPSFAIILVFKHNKGKLDNNITFAKKNIKDQTTKWENCLLLLVPNV